MATITDEACKIRVTNPDGTFTPAMQSILQKYGYTEIDGEWWMLGGELKEEDYEPEVCFQPLPEDSDHHDECNRGRPSSLTEWADSVREA